MASGRQSIGPRAILKTQKCREIAELEMRRQQEEVFTQQNDSPYEKVESTAASANYSAAERLVRPSCLNVTSEEELAKLAPDKGGGQGNEAVTYWSHEVISGNKSHFRVTRMKRGSLFAKCTSFSNDIEDARLRHDDAVEISENSPPE